MSDDMFYARVCAERDALRAELAAAKERGDGLYLGLRQTLEALGGVAQPGVSEAFLILGVPGEAAALKRVNTALAADNARLRAALECVPVDLIHAIENGDTGANVFLSAGSCKLIGEALSSTPTTAEWLAARDAEQRRIGAAEALEDIAKEKGIDGGMAYCASVVYREFPDRLTMPIGVVDAADLMFRAARLRAGKGE